jgi:hypothetical protein
MNASDLELLKLELEKKMGGGIESQKDLKLLQNAIEVSVNKKLGFNTLRRFFSFLKSGKPNNNTLQTLCEFCGYPSVAEFQIKCRKNIDWYLWKQVYRIENENLISKNDLQWLLAQQNHPDFIHFFSSVLTANFRSKNTNNLKLLLSNENRIVIKYEDQIKLASSLGLLFRKIDLEDFLFLFNSTQLNQFYTFLFIDYSEISGTYGKVINYLIDKTKPVASDYLFISLIFEYHRYLKGEKEIKIISNQFNETEIHPLLLGRWTGYQLISKPFIMEEEKFIFSLAKKHKAKNQFFYELFPACILTKRISLLEKIIDKYYEELFENTNWVTYTENCIYLIGYCFVNIANDRPHQGFKNLEFINFDHVLDSYKEYIKLFYLIAHYQAELKIGTDENLLNLEKEYTSLAKKMGFKRFDQDLLKNYFDNTSFTKRSPSKTGIASIRST